MAKTTVNEIITFLKLSLSESGIQINQLALFGSQLKGTAYEESDIDLIIVSNDFENKDVFQRSKMTMEAELKTLRKFMIPLDILNMTLEEYRKVVANKRFQTHVL